MQGTARTAGPSTPEGMMLLKSADLAQIHRHCTRHRPQLERAREAGCISCGSHFAPDEIREWEAEEDGAAETARCPRCGRKAVFAADAPIALDQETLAALQAYWFGGA